MSHAIRKLDFGLCEIKGADQLRSNCQADQPLCFHYSDSTISLLPKSQNFKLLAIFCACTAWFVSDLYETPKTGFLRSWLTHLALVWSPT